MRHLFRRIFQNLFSSRGAREGAFGRTVMVTNGWIRSKHVLEKICSNDFPSLRNRPYMMRSNNRWLCKNVYSWVWILLQDNETRSKFQSFELAHLKHPLINFEIRTESKRENKCSNICKRRRMLPDIKLFCLVERMQKHWFMTSIKCFYSASSCTINRQKETHAADSCCWPTMLPMPNDATDHHHCCSTTGSMQRDDWNAKTRFPLISCTTCGLN